MEPIFYPLEMGVIKYLLLLLLRPLLHTTAFGLVLLVQPQSFHAVRAKERDDEFDRKFPHFPPREGGGPKVPRRDSAVAISGPVS